MADERADVNEAPPKTDHMATYSFFMTITKWGIGFVALVLVLMALFLV